MLIWAAAASASLAAPSAASEATTATVSDVTALGDAVGNSLITRIVVDPGYYDLTSISCGSGGQLHCLRSICARRSRIS